MSNKQNDIILETKEEMQEEKGIQELAEQAGLIVSRDNEDEELEFLGTDKQRQVFKELLKANN